MNSYLLAQRFGRLSPQAFQRAQNEQLIQTIEPDPDIAFAIKTAVASDLPQPSSTQRNLSSVRDVQASSAIPEVRAHKASVNVLAIDQQAGRCLISGGTDASIRLWDLETPNLTTGSSSDFLTNPTATYNPAASLLRSHPSSHTHSLTSLSLYPHDPTPTTILSTSHDNTLKVTLIRPSSHTLSPIHSFPLPSTPHAHSLPTSPTTPHPHLIAVGTSHPLLPLLDLRTGSSTHSLPGHTSAILSVAWSPSPSSPHTLASSSASGLVLLHDIRRANSAYATLDAEDAIGVLPPAHTPEYAGREPLLDWNARAHSGPVTGIVFTASGRQIVTCGHDQRIRVWDAATGRNELVHFGPRVRNQRYGEFKPLLSPAGFEGSRSGRGGETMLWANDDAKGEILEFDLLEGSLRRVLRVPGVDRSNVKVGGRGKGRQVARPERMLGAGMTNTMIWRMNAGSGAGVEMYSGHGDGRIRAWVSGSGAAEEDEDAREREAEEEARRKRKRDVLGELVEGLTKKPVTFG
ncbi:MAG: hypothetical protein Q9160_002583 [Pyrenula sp. 1 TL-2023]